MSKARIWFFKLLMVISTMLLAMAFVSRQRSMNLSSPEIKKLVVAILRKHILEEAKWAMQQEPETVTAHVSPRTAGGKHDFFSEGDYWWPNPASADSPYIQKDGMTNPENFVSHRLSMIRLSRIVGALASAYKITGDKKYVLQAMKHCSAWFINKETMMNANLLYAQAIKGRFSGEELALLILYS